MKETLGCTSKVRRTCLLWPQYNSYYSIPICTYHRAPSKGVVSLLRVKISSLHKLRGHMHSQISTKIPRIHMPTHVHRSFAKNNLELLKENGIAQRKWRTLSLRQLNLFLLKVLFLNREKTRKICSLMELKIALSLCVSVYV